MIISILYVTGQILNKTQDREYANSTSGSLCTSESIKWDQLKTDGGGGVGGQLLPCCCL